MFNSKTQNTPSDALDLNSHNTIGAGTVITGEINIEGNVRIDGTIKGNLISKGKIVLGPNSVVEGEVECKQASISGKVLGKVIAHELISIKSTAQIEGDVYYSKLEVDNGAQINGSLLSSVSKKPNLKKVASNQPLVEAIAEN